MLNGDHAEITRGSKGFFLHIGSGKHPHVIKISKELLQDWIAKIEKIKRGE
jgi:hypothetical protein